MIHVIDMISMMNSFTRNEILPLLRAAGMEALLEPEMACVLIGDCRQPDRGTRAAQRIYTINY